MSSATSQLVSRNYTHMDDATQRMAIQIPPNIITAKAVQNACLASKFGSNINQ